MPPEDLTTAAPPVDVTTGTEPKREDPTLAYERGRADAMAEALSRVGRPPVDPTAPANAQPAIPDNPMDLLSEAERENLKVLQMTDPLQAGRILMELGSKHAQAKMIQQAGGLMASQGRTIIELFKNRMRFQDQALAAKIEPLFDSSLRGKNLAALVNMNDDARESELTLYWNAARGQVLADQIRNAVPPKPEPTLTAPDTGGSGDTPKSVLDIDPAIAAMARQYGFTPEQLAEIEAEL